MEDEKGGLCRTIVQMRNACKILIGKQGRGSLEIPTSRREDNIKIDLKETEFEGVGSIYLVQDMTQWRTILNIVEMLHNLKPSRRLNSIKPPREHSRANWLLVSTCNQLTQLCAREDFIEQ
jgi:hypothetical protein